MSYVVSNQQATRSGRESHRQHRAMTITLWSVQVVLALIFLFAGSMKLVLPIEVMTAQMPLPGLFLRFIGVCEVAGALGLILPGLTRIQRGLTPLAVGALAACVAYGRRSWVARA